MRHEPLTHDSPDCIQVDETTVHATYVCLKTNEWCIEFPLIGKVHRKKALSIARWLRPTPNQRQTVITKNAPNRLIQQLGARNYRNQWFINSAELNRFLRKTFSFETVSKLEYPLTDFVPKWIENGVDARTIALLLLLTEGGGRRSRNIYFYNRNKLFHDLLFDCVWQISGEVPTSYMIPSKYRTKTGETRNTPDTEYWQKEIVNEIYRLTPSLKCKPAVGQSAESYFCESQPNASFLIEGNHLEKELMALLLLGTEGYITAYNNQHGFCTTAIGFRCAHPVLLEQFTHIFRDVGIHMAPFKDKTFSGFGGAHNQSYDTAKKVLQLVLKHGDLLGRIHGNSLYHEGYRKVEILIGSLDVYLQQKCGKLSRKISREMLHRTINHHIDEELTLEPRDILKLLSHISRIHRNVRSKHEKRQ